MSEPITLPAPTIDLTGPPHTRWEREHQAFRRLLPELLTTYRGRYVAIHEEQVGDETFPLGLRVLCKVGHVATHIGLVTEAPEPRPRSGVRREVPETAAA